MFATIEYKLGNVEQTLYELKLEREGGSVGVIGRKGLTTGTDREQV